MADGTKTFFDKDLWGRGWDAIQRLILLIMLVGMHYLVSLALKATIPSLLEKALELAETVVYVFFLLVYVYLLWDMVVVFIPYLRKKRGIDNPAVLEASDAEAE